MTATWDCPWLAVRVWETPTSFAEVQGHRCKTLYLGCSDQQDWNLALVPDRGDRAAVNQVPEKPMAVRGHRDQVALLAVGGLEDFGRRVSERKMDTHLESASRRVLACCCRYTRSA